MNKLYLRLESANWKIFFITFGLVFLMTLLPKLGFKIDRGDNQLITPANFDLYQNVKPKLQNIPNNFRLQKGDFLVKTTLAGSDKVLEESIDQAKGYLALDFDSGEVLADKNFNSKLPIASILSSR